MMAMSQGVFEFILLDINFILDTRRGGERSHLWRGRIVFFSFIFSRGVAGVAGVACVRAWRAWRAMMAWRCCESAYPLWEHRIFDGAPFMKG